jgi:hypothetical protein
MQSASRAARRDPVSLLLLDFLKVRIYPEGIQLTDRWCTDMLSMQGKNKILSLQPPLYLHLWRLQSAKPLLSKASRAYGGSRQVNWYEGRETHKKGEEQTSQLILCKRATPCHDPAMDEGPIEMNEG